MDGGELLRVPVPSRLHVVVDEGHDLVLGLGGGDHRLDAQGGKFLLVQPGLDGAVGGQDARALSSLGGQGLGRLPDHVEDGDAHLLLDPVQEVVGGVAGDGDDGAPRPLQQLGVGQEPAVHPLPGGLGAQNGGGAVGHVAVRQDQCVDVLLVPLGVGPVNDELIEGVGSLRPHAAQDTETIIHKITTFEKGELQ